MPSPRTLLRLVALASALALPLAVFAGGEKVKKIEPKTVCMAMDVVAGASLPAVVVAGKSYYYGTTDCSEQLVSDAARRVAIDPVTHKEVDKSEAVVAVTPEGKVLYFESDKTLAQYNAKS